MTASSLLWQLQPPEGQPRWLFGSMHVRDNRVYQFGEKLYPLIAGADVFVGEMELDPQPELIIPNTYDLKQHVSKTAYDKMRKQFLKSFHFDVERFNHFHPLITISTLSQSLLAIEHQVSLDEHLWHFAKSLGKEVSGLESYEEQLKLLHSIDPVPLYRQLLKMSRKPSSIGQQTHGALTWYMNSNIHQLYRITKSSMHGLRKRIIYERNRIMVNRMIEFSTVKSYFVVVGAGHLSGKYGLLALLKKAGWKIKAIPLLDAS